MNLGRAVNPAYSDLDQPAILKAKIHLIDELVTCLKRMDKQIEASYF
jgi:hypothetical protein